MATQPDAVTLAVQTGDDQVVLVRASADGVTIGEPGFDPLLTLTRDQAGLLADVMGDVLARTQPISDETLTMLAEL